MIQDPGVPNSCPFKEDVLKEVEAGRHRKQEMRDKKRDEMKQRREEAKERELEEKRTKVIEYASTSVKYGLAYPTLLFTVIKKRL